MATSLSPTDEVGNAVTDTKNLNEMDEDELDRAWEEMKAKQASRKQELQRIPEASKTNDRLPASDKAPTSVCTAALEALERKGGFCDGELQKLPADYPTRRTLGTYALRYLPEGYSEADAGPIMLGNGNHKKGLSFGDLQKQMPTKQELKELKGVVKYKGPQSNKHVMKQAATNCELEKAVQDGDSDRVAALLRYGKAMGCVNPNAPLYPRREKVLHVAARGGYRDICIMLIEAKAEIECDEITDGKHPIHDACNKGSYDVVELLLNHRANIEETTFNSMRPIHWACQSGHRDVADLLLDRQAKIHAACGNHYQPIHYAAKEGHADVVQLLCKRGAKINVEGKGDRRPIHLACISGHLEVATVLMDFGTLGVADEFCHRGALFAYQETPLEELMHNIERLRFQRDEAEEFCDMGQEDEGLEAFKDVIKGFRKLGMENSAKGALEDACRLGLDLDDNGLTE